MEVETHSAERTPGKFLQLADLSTSAPAEIPQDDVWEFNYNGTDFIISKYHIITIVLAIGMLIGFILGRAQRACCCKRRRVADVNQQRVGREVEMNASSNSSSSTSTSSSSSSPSPRRVRRKPVKPVKPVKPMKAKAMGQKPNKKEDRQQKRLSSLDRGFGIGMDLRPHHQAFFAPNFPYNPQLSIPTTSHQLPHREFFPPTAPPPPPGVLPVTLNNNTGFSTDQANPGQRVPQAQPGPGHDSVWIG